MSWLDFAAIVIGITLGTAAANWCTNWLRERSEK